VLLGYLAAALYLNFAIPLGYGPDEVQHLQYLRHVADEHRLPRLHPEPAENVASQESGQPPLYYVTAAVLTGWVPWPSVASRAAPLLWRVLETGRRHGWTTSTAPIYDAPRDFWPQATAVHGYAARLVSTLAGLLALVALYLLLREVMESAALALAGLAWLGWNLNFPYLHAFITNDAFLALFSALSLWLLVRWVRCEARPRQAVGLGFVLSALALTKLNGLAVVAVAGGVLLLTARRDAGRGLLTVAGVFAAATGWWFVRNLWLYGDPTGVPLMRAIEAAKGGLYPQPLGGRALWDVLRGTYYTFSYPPSRLVDLWNGAGVLGLLVAWRERARRKWLLLFGTLVILMVVLYLRWASRFVYGTHPRLTLSMWPALAALWALGFAAWLPKRMHTGVLGATLLLMGWHLWTGVQPRAGSSENAGYMFMPVLSALDAPRVDRELDVRFGDELHLVGQATARRENVLFIALHWELVGSISDPTTSFYLHLIDVDHGKRVAQVDTYHEVDTIPLVAWRKGQRVVTVYRLPIPPGTTRFEVYAGAYSRRTMKPLPAQTGTGEWLPGDQVLVLQSGIR